MQPNHCEWLSCFCDDSRQRKLFHRRAQSSLSRDPNTHTLTIRASLTRELVAVELARESVGWAYVGRGETATFHTFELELVGRLSPGGI